MNAPVVAPRSRTGLSSTELTVTVTAVLVVAVNPPDARSVAAMLTTAEPLKCNLLVANVTPAASAKVALIAATWPDNVTEFVPLPDAEVTPLVTSNLTVNVPLVTLPQPHVVKYYQHQQLHDQ